MLALVFNGVTGANLNPELQKVQDVEAPKLAAHQDAIFLNAKLFQRVSTIYKQRASLKLDPEVAAPGGISITSNSCTPARISPTPTRLNSRS